MRGTPASDAPLLLPRSAVVKGYGAEYVAEYVGATTGNDALNVGEYW